MGKLTAQTALTAITAADILYVVDDPGGTPLSRKITIADFFGGTTAIPVSLVLGADIEIGSADNFFYGDPLTDTTWKTVRSGTKLSFQRREAGAYVEKGFFDASFHSEKIVAEADGTLAAPAYTFASDTDTGLIRQAANVCAIVAGGVECIRAEAAIAAVNCFLFTPAAAGVGPTISVEGSDANIDLTLIPKGTGRVVIDSSLNVTQFGTPGTLSLRRANGTSVSPTPVLTNEDIGYVQFKGMSAAGGAFLNGSRIKGKATENWSATVTGSALHFETTLNGTTGMVTRLKIPNDGGLNLPGIAAPALSPAGSGTIYFDSASNKLKVSENGGAYVNIV